MLMKVREGRKMSFERMKAMDINFADEDTTDLKGFDESLVIALRRVLRTAFSYADDIPTNIYTYMQLQKDSVKIHFLYKLNGKIVEPSTLNKAGFEGHKFDVSQKRQNELQKYIAEDISGMLLPTFAQWKKRLPNEIYAWINIKDEYPTFSLSYNIGKNHVMPDMLETVAEWTKEIKDPNSSLLNDKISVFGNKLTYKEIDSF